MKERRKMKKISQILGVVLASLMLTNAEVSAQKIPDTDAQIKKEVNEMSLDEKLGQLYVSPSVKDPKLQIEDIKKYHLGGVVLFGDDFTGNKEEFKEKLQSYQNNSEIPLLIATDQEGSSVSRLDSDPQLTNNRLFPSPQQMFAEQGMKGVVTEASQTAKILKDLGINWNFAPVADVAESSDSFIYERTLGEDYPTTATYIKKVVPAMQQQGVAATLKHFPGYGDAADTHVGFGETTKDKKTMQNEDLLPFKAGVKAKVDSIMVGHVVAKGLDKDHPASMSKKVNQYLRRDLNYQGVVLTDDLTMGAILDYAKANHVNPDLLALQSGNDMLLSNNYDKGIPEIKQAIKQGKLSEKQVDQSVYRVLKMKQKLHLK